MDAVIQYFMGDPIPKALVGSQYIYYILPAFAIVAARIARRSFTRAEWWLLATYAFCMGVEFVQLAAHGFDFSGERMGSWGVSRYFGVFAPLMWIWVAWAAAKLWSAPRGRWLWASRAAVVAALGLVLVQQNVGQLHTVYTTGTRPDVQKACSAIAKAIKRDYAGPARQAERKRTLHEYYSTRRPVVFSDYGAAAWLVGGQSEGALHGTGFCPYPDDYLFIRVGSGYGWMETVDSNVYDYVGYVRGVDTVWRLFRRKTTPHR